MVTRAHELQGARDLRPKLQEHEEHEQRSRELLRKHKMLLHESGSKSGYG